MIVSNLTSCLEGLGLFHSWGFFGTDLSSYWDQSVLFHSWDVWVADWSFVLHQDHHKSKSTNIAIVVALLGFHFIYPVGILLNLHMKLDMINDVKYDIIFWTFHVTIHSLVIFNDIFIFWFVKTFWIWYTISAIVIVLFSAIINIIYTIFCPKASDFIFHLHVILR